MYPSPALKYRVLDHWKRPAVWGTWHKPRTDCPWSAWHSSSS